MDSSDTRFEIILNAGNSESASLMAIEAAREYRFGDAKKEYEEAVKELHLAHQTQTSLLQDEARGESIEMDILMVHAQDHITMASILKEVANEFINVYEELKELKEEVK